MSPFNADQHLPTFKRIIPAAGGWSLRAIRKTYKYTLGFLLLLVLAHIITTAILGQMLKEDIAALKAKGAPTTMADLARPKIPDSENGAVLYAEALEMMSTSQAQKDIAVAREFSYRSHKGCDPALWNKTAAVLPRLQGILQLTEQASSRPKCQFPVEWTDYLSRVRPLSELGMLACLARTDALVNARKGRMDAAVKSLALGFKIGDSLKDESGLVAYDVRISGARTAARTVEDVLKYGGMSESQAKRLFDGLADIQLAPGWVNALRTRRAMDIRSYDWVCKGQIPLSHMLALWGIRGEEMPLGRLPRVVLRPLLYADERDYLKRTEETIRYASTSFPERKRLRLLERLDREFSPYAILSPWLCGDQWVGNDGVRVDANVAGVRTLLALAAYKDRFGSYPASLNALEKRLGWNLPKDPFSGKDLLYRPKGKGFILYSVGENLKDDHAIPRPNGPGPQDGYYYGKANGQVYADIVWQMDH